MTAKIEFGDVVPYLTPKRWLEDLHALLAALVHCFHRHSLFYLPMAGTLLGIVRNNDYIPWDDDVDLAVRFKDYHRIMALNDDPSAAGSFTIDDRAFPWQEGKSWRVMKCVSAKNTNIFIDLFPFIVVRDELRMPPRGKVPKKWYRRNVFKLRELVPLRYRLLRDLPMLCPNDPEGFIKRSYGANALEECIVTHKHDAWMNLKMKIEKWLGVGTHNRVFPCNILNNFVHYEGGRRVQERGGCKVKKGERKPTRSFSCACWVVLLSLVLLVILTVGATSLYLGLRV